MRYSLRLKHIILFTFVLAAVGFVQWVFYVTTDRDRPGTVVWSGACEVIELSGTTVDLECSGETSRVFDNPYAIAAAVTGTTVECRWEISPVFKNRVLKCGPA